MKLYKPAALALGTTLTVALLAGCAGSAENDAGGPITLSFQAFANTTDGQTANQAIVDAWNENHPDIQIDLVLTPIDSVYEKLSTQAAGGTLPDIFMDDAQDIRQYVEQGFVADLHDHLSEETVDSIDEGVRGAVQIDDILAGIPIEMQTYVVFANRGLIEASGQEVPTGDSLSWDDLEALASATSSSGVHGLAWGLKSPTAAFVSLGLGFGAEYFSGEGGEAKLDVGAAEMDIPNRVKDMIEAGSLDPAGVSQSSADVLPTFYAGQAAMLLQQSYHIANFETDAPEGVDWVVLPPLEGSDGSQQAAIPSTISVSAESDHIEEAAQFLDFYMEAENLAELNLAEGLIPPTQEGRDVLASLAADKTGWGAVLQSGESLVPAPASAATNYPGWKTTVATPAYQQFLSGAIDEKQLKSQLVDGWNQTNR
ncbi:extracellular solute-binding protein [Microbacterium luteolum]|uniref:Extracellular solute-binding protein n=1 Tax=Microbacterium luteolum TaxID=69367 RepID=A0ABY7XT69_MICLT|nr:extracellular solute-binding protein [Microbacterium luteolum]WDM44343.1 extracellular solute-binding protein [Microbacterium luteolum]